MIKLQDVWGKVSDSCRKVFGSFDETAFYLSTVDFKEKYYSCVNCCLVRFSGFRVKKCQVIWETVSARVYELLSTSTKEKRFFPIWWETFVFQSVCNFSKFVGFKDKYFQFFSIEFFGRVVKAAFRCPEEHFMEKTNLKQPFFLKPFFRILNKKYSDFSQKFFGRFRKNRSTCPEEQSMKNYETKKELINKTISRNFFWQLSDFWWNFSGHFDKTVFYLPVTFWWKAAFASEILIGKFFLDIGRKLSRFWRYCFRHSFQTAFYVPEGEKIVSCIFWAKTLVLKVSVNFHRLTDSERNFFSFFQRNFVRVVKAAFYVSKGTVYEKVWVKKRTNAQNYFQDFVLTTFGLLVEFFRPFWQNCILPSSNFLMESSICEWNSDW